MRKFWTSLDRETAYYQDLLATIRGISKTRSSPGPVERVKSKSEALLNDLHSSFRDWSASTVPEP